MILLDTNILIYCFEADSRYHRFARQSVVKSAASGQGVINPIILAELAAGDDQPETLSSRVLRWGIQVLDLPHAAAIPAAHAFNVYLSRRKQSGIQHIHKTPLPDFLIGAHAAVMGWPIVTIDVDRYRTYFPEVPLITPEVNS